MSSGRAYLFRSEIATIMDTIFLVTYCDDRDIIYLKTLLQTGDLLVGIDQGILRLLAHNLSPDYYIGDWDSLVADLKPLIQQKVPSKNIIELQSEKDDSDLEHALKYFTPQKKNMVIVNNLQGRIDHALSAISLLAGTPNICIKSATTTVYLSTGQFTLTLPVQTTISLIPFTETVDNITTTGLYYQLSHEILHKTNSRGLSNFNIDKNIHISFSGGKLLVIINH